MQWVLGMWEGRLWWVDLVSCQCKFSFMSMQWVLGMWEGRVWWVDLVSCQCKFSFM